MNTAPLAGVTVLEFSGLGPAPQAVWQLADLGAEVVTVLRGGQERGVFRTPETQRAIHALDLRSTIGLATARTLITEADVLVEGFRPGVMERLGLGPDDALSLNPGLVYGRLTGWGQHGPLSERAGHDLNYLGLTGALHAITDADGHPVPPLNMIGDGGGGTMNLVVGVLSGLLSRQRDGQGCVIDAAIIDGAFALNMLVWQLRAEGRWTDQPRSNLLDGGAPWYDVYECQDGKYMAVAALEPAFYSELLGVLGLDEGTLPDRNNRKLWPVLRIHLRDRILAKDRDEWAALAFDKDACFTPVLNFEEAMSHPHVQARAIPRAISGQLLPARSPRFSSSATRLPSQRNR